MNTAAAADFVKYPTYKRAYLRAFAKAIENRKKAGLEIKDGWETPEKMMEWWLSDRSKTDEPIDGQIEMEF